jgi:SMC interacting uncharacterized protein involved in chromosome segregation
VLEYGSFLSNAERHLDRAAELQEEIRALQRENSQGMKELRESLKETGQLIKELRESQKETDRMIKETDQMIKENDRLAKEAREQSKETDKKIKELATRFTSTTGRIIEGLMSSSGIKIYEDAGFKVDSLCKNFKRKNKALNLAMEMDVLLFNDKQVIVEEVKSSCDKKDVDKFVRNMENFKRLYNEFEDKEVFGAIATVNYEEDADQYAHEQGLFVVRVSSEEIFSLDPFKLEKLKRF